MDLKLNPNEELNFASCSMDASIKLWNIKYEKSSGTLSGHTAGVNCLSYYEGDKPLLLSGGDDFQVIIWDLTTRIPIAKLKNHS